MSSMTNPNKPHKTRNGVLVVATAKGTAMPTKRSQPTATDKYSPRLFKRMCFAAHIGFAIQGSLASCVDGFMPLKCNWLPTNNPIDGKSSPVTGRIYQQRSGSEIAPLASAPIASTRDDKHIGKEQIYGNGRAIKRTLVFRYVISVKNGAVHICQSIPSLPLFSLVAHLTSYDQHIDTLQWSVVLSPNGVVVASKSK